MAGIARKICSAAGAAFLLSLTAQPASAALMPGYTAFNVTTATDGFTFTGEAAINNGGEIAYLRATRDTAEVFSTRRGQLTNSGANDARFPDINDGGEVVYADVGSGPGLQVFSSIGGQLTGGNLAHINNHGDIAFERFNSLWMYNASGNIRFDTGELNSLRPIHLADSGELFYSGRDSNRVNQLFSSTRGAITSFSAGTPFVTSFAVNDLGEYVYGQNQTLYASDGSVLWDGPFALVTDMNDYGDILVSRPIAWKDPLAEHEVYGTYDIVLLTRRPELFAAQFDLYTDYPSYEPPAPTGVPEPGALSLLSLGLLAVAFRRSRRRQL